ncbi:MAG: phosphoribosylformylglycinamidine synthase I [Chloroflexi bacterium]|nr:phosphoribosylformylglycinamidine synthase I [Chloroflexota bacterium]
MGKVKTLVLRAPGTNCDAEAAFAFQQAGAEASLVHVNQLIRREQHLSDYHIMVIPGGFTYGDDIAAGKVLANELSLKLGEDIVRFVKEGKLILGICNGFQVLAKAGFLPELSNNGSSPLTLANNDSGRFECRWIYLGVNKQSNCVFTKGMDRLYLPVAHGEGKVVADPAILPKLNVAVYYTDAHGDANAGYPHNPNGSVNDIAGICDSSGRIFGLMPHPERHIRGTQHPQWTRLGAQERGDGFPIFRNAIEWAKGL